MDFGAIEPKPSSPNSVGMFDWFSGIPLGVVNWLAGIPAVVFGWFALNFVGKPFLEFRKVRQEIQGELTYLSNVHPPSDTTFYEGTDEEYNEEIRIFAEACEKTRRLGSNLSALSIDRTLVYLLRIFNYDLNKAAKNLLLLSIEVDDQRKIISRYYVESALKLPHINKSWAKKLMEEQKRGREAAEQRRKTAANPPT